MVQSAAVALAGASLFGVAALAPAPAAAKSARRRWSTKGLRRARFAPHAGTQVKFRPAGAPAVRLQFVGVEDLGGPAVRHLAGSEHAYLLRFRGPRALQLAQGTVGIRHKRFGVVRLFVTASGSTARTQDYVAIVNRVVPRRRRR